MILEFTRFIFLVHIIQNMAITILIINYYSHLSIMVIHLLIFNIIVDFYELLRSKKLSVNIVKLFI